MNASTCGKDLTAFEEIFLPPNQLQLSDYFPLLRSLELLSPATKYSDSHTSKLCEVFFFTKKKEHLQLCELSERQ